MYDKDKALEGLEQLATEVGRNILQAPVSTLLNSYQATMEGLSEAAPINILPDRTVPLSDAAIIMAHNAYNSVSGSAMWPNQQLSLTELLDLGVRGLEFDVHWDKGAVRLCHELCIPELPGILIGYNRPLAEALKEVQAWLTIHQTEVVILKFEDYLNPEKTGAPEGVLTEVLQDTLNISSVFTPSNLTTTFKNTWPSIDQLCATGKQIILMPQSSQEDKSLFFNGNWGRYFKNPFNTGTIAKIRPNDLSVPRRYVTELLEVGEDRSFAGSVVDTARKIPILGGFIPSNIVAGQMTKEEIQKLRDHKVNLISLDNIERADSRLTESVTLSDFSSNAYVFIPIAIVAAALTPRDAGSKQLLTTGQRIFMQLLIAVTLPAEGRVLYSAVDTGISSYNATVDERQKAGEVITTLGRVSAVGHALISATGKGVETIAKIGLSNITGIALNDTYTSSTVLGTIGKATLNIVAAKTIMDPLIGMATGVYEGRGVVQGLYNGVDSAMFGLTDFSGKGEQQRTQQQVAKQDSDAIAHRPVTRSMTKTTPASHQQAVIRKRNTNTKQGYDLE